MLTPEVAASFDRDGFVRIPDVFSPDQIATLRSDLRRIFKSPRHDGDIEQNGKLGSIRFDVCTRYPELRWLLVHPPLVAALRGILGEDFLYLPETSAHYGGYGTWHKDTTSQERAGKKFHWDPDFRMVQAAIYLQPNDATWGGGLEVLPGSHNLPDRHINVIDRNVFDKVRTKLKDLGVVPTQSGHRVPSQAGDLVIFHMRLDHKASWPSTNATPPDDREKLAIFLSCSRNDKHAREYFQYIKARPDYVYLRGHRYPDEMLAVAREHGVHLFDGE